MAKHKHGPKAHQDDSRDPDIVVFSMRPNEEDAACFARLREHFGVTRVQVVRMGLRAMVREIEKAKA